MKTNTALESINHRNKKSKHLDGKTTLLQFSSSNCNRHKEINIMNINVEPYDEERQTLIDLNEAHILHQEDARIDAHEDMMYMQEVA